MTFFSAIRGPEGNRGPIYIQLERILRDAIRDGTLSDAEALPTERAMAEQYGVSRITVRKALMHLQREGLLTRKRGSGTFVTPRESSPAGVYSFADKLVENGKLTHSIWLRQDQDTVTTDEAMLLGLPPGGPMYRLKRIRYADDIPVAVEAILVPWQPGTGPLTVVETLYDALRPLGLAPVRALQRLRAVALDADIASQLNVETGSAGLFVERRGFLADGRTAEVTKGWYRGDMSDLITEVAVS